MMRRRLDALAVRAREHAFGQVALGWEPVSGIEPLTCRLQEAWPNATCALPAQMTQVIALMATAALGFLEASSHEPSHEKRHPDIHGRNRA